MKASRYSGAQKALIRKQGKTRSLRVLICRKPSHELLPGVTARVDSGQGSSCRPGLRRGMEHAIHRPTVFAASAIRSFLKAVASGLLILSLIIGLFELYWPYEKSLVEAPFIQEFAPRVDCGGHAESGSSHCQQSETPSLLAECVVSNQVFRSVLRFSTLDALARFQHRPDGPLRPPTPFSSVA